MTNVTGGYDATLEQFARGKRLARLAKFIRVRPGDRCDACGSTLPRLLFGLKDAQTERCYFVGQNCLNWLLEAGLVARARFRQSSENAYEREMKLRRDDEVRPLANGGEILVPASADVLPRVPATSTTSAPALTPSRWIRQDGALIFEQPRFDAEQILIVIAISRLPRLSDGAIGYGR